MRLGIAVVTVASFSNIFAIAIAPDARDRSFCNHRSRISNSDLQLGLVVDFLFFYLCFPALCLCCQDGVP